SRRGTEFVVPSTYCVNGIQLRHHSRFRRHVLNTSIVRSPGAMDPSACLGASVHSETGNGEMRARGGDCAWETCVSATIVSRTTRRSLNTDASMMPEDYSEEG